ncbi:MAG TPA: PEP-CTERM sorting domain-containing protein [Chthoniobacteraceae bacterium]|nr:PEP-CTERM sorting domain-containing protein [Chthoniobacteraceae bacterium]
MKKRHPLIPLLALMMGSGSLHAQLYWNATGPGPHDWSDTANWVDDTDEPTAPLAPVESRKIYFGASPGATAANSYTVRLDAEGGSQTLEGGMVFSGNASGSGTTVTMDLNDQSLILNGGELGWWREAATQYGGNTIRFEGGGTLRVGAVLAASIDLGRRYASFSTANQTTNNTLVVGAGTTFDTANTSNIWVAANGENFHHNYTLDLQAATLRSGSQADTLKVANTIGAGVALATATNGNSSKNGVIRLGNLSLLEIGNDLILGQSNENKTGYSYGGTYQGELVFSPTQGTTPVTVRIGRDLRLGVEENSTGVISTPEVMHLSVGSAETRGGKILVGHRAIVKTVAAERDAVGSLVAKGGSFNAYIEELSVGFNANTHETEGESTAGTATGTLDFSSAELGVLDISGSARVGVGREAVGTLLLAGGEARSASLTVGNASLTAARSTLGLDETLWSVSGDFLLGELGDVHISLGSQPAGLEVEGSFLIADGGVMTVDFSSLGGEGFLWALKLAGEQQSLLEGYLLDGQLAGTGEYASLATVVQDGGYTYYGIAAIPEPGTYVLLFGGTLLGLAFGRKGKGERG